MTTACRVGRLPGEHKQQCQRIRPIDFTVAVDIKIRNTPTWQTVRHLPQDLQKKNDVLNVNAPVAIGVTPEWLDRDRRS